MRSPNSRPPFLNKTGQEYGFGLYVHWPYCARICPYCDFNVYKDRPRDSEPLLGKMVADLKSHRERLPDHRGLQSLFLGGGTPSLLSPDKISRLVTAADDIFGIANGFEITLEANPNDILKGDLSGWRTAGVQRLSIGVQSFRDDALKFLGRDHDATSAR